MARRRKKQQPTQQPAQQQPRSNPQNRFSTRHFQSSDYDVDEVPVRSAPLARELIKLINHCPEAAAALEITCAYALSSGTGDEMGVSIQEDPNSPEPQTVAIANEMLLRAGSIFDFWQVIWRMLAWGDAFAAIEVDTRRLEVVRLQVLPTWQMFRIEDDYGHLQRFEQRLPGLRSPIEVDPLIGIHWAYNKRYMYGRSIYYECRRQWDALERADQDLYESSRDASLIPNIHEMPLGTDENYKTAYKTEHEERKKRGIISDIYLGHGGKVYKPFGGVTQYPLAGVESNLNLRLRRISSRSRVPLYLLGADVKYAREIAFQPAIAFVVHVGVVRQLFAAGLRHMIDLELALKGVKHPWHYRITFPKINVNPWQPIIEGDQDSPGISDVDGGDE